MCKTFFNNFLPCLVTKEDTWTFERAPEPNDIFWENMKVTTCKRIRNLIASMVVTLLLMGGCFLFITLLKSSANNRARLLSWSSSIAVVVVNELLLFVMRRLSRAEEPRTLTDLNVSVALKLTLARFLNSSLVLIFVNRNPSHWFKEGDLAYDASLLIGIMAFSPPIKMILWIPRLIKVAKIYYARRNGDEACQLTQREANLLCEGTTTDPANAISEYMNLIMTCMFYSPILP